MAGAAHRHPWKISDVVIFPMVALALVLEWLWPTTIGVPAFVRITLGGALAIGGFALITWSKRLLDRAGQPSLPGSPTTGLVTDGAFALSRNPNYLGAVIAAMGAGIGLGSFWLIGAALPIVIILDLWMIRPEERYLTACFGPEYQAYRARVRRWI